MHDSFDFGKATSLSVTTIQFQTIGRMGHGLLPSSHLSYILRLLHCWCFFTSRYLTQCKVSTSYAHVLELFVEHARAVIALLLSHITQSQRHLRDDIQKNDRRGRMSVWCSERTSSRAWLYSQIFEWTHVF